MGKLDEETYANLNHETARIIAVVANIPEFLNNENAYKNQESEGYNMCLAMEELRADFKAEGKIEGDQARLIVDLRNLMETTKWSVEQAMNALKVPEENRAHIGVLIKAKAEA